MTNQEDLRPENRATRRCQEAIKLEDLSRDSLHNTTQCNTNASRTHSHAHSWQTTNSGSETGHSGVNPVMEEQLRVKQEVKGDKSQLCRAGL